MSVRDWISCETMLTVFCLNPVDCVGKIIPSTTKFAMPLMRALVNSLNNSVQLEKQYVITLNPSTKRFIMALMRNLVNSQINLVQLKRKGMKVLMTKLIACLKNWMIVCLVDLVPLKRTCISLVTKLIVYIENMNRFRIMSTISKMNFVCVQIKII